MLPRGLACRGGSEPKGALPEDSGAGERQGMSQRLLGPRRYAVGEQAGEQLLGALPLVERSGGRLPDLEFCELSVVDGISLDSPARPVS